LVGSQNLTPIGICPGKYLWGFLFVQAAPLPYFYMMILQPGNPLHFIPQRIVSLVPSQTELLHYLGLEEETVGITKFCIHPAAWFKNKIKVGGTKNINIGLIKKLQPDLIIANKEENVKEQIDELAKKFTVLVTDVNTIADGLKMIRVIGKIAGKEKVSADLVTAVQNQFAKIILPKKTISAAYLIWKDPYMTVGGDTFINDVLDKCGLRNIFADKQRYPEVTITDLSIANLQLLLLSSEPYPFKQKHIDELQQQLPGTKIILVNGEMFSWYGSRMLLMPAYLNRLIESVSGETSDVSKQIQFD
jgi:ABC-type Fe3+-hydroxamate transport system substrate-binding protein